MKKLIYAFAALTLFACVKENNTSKKVQTSYSYLVGDANDSTGITATVISNADIALHLESKSFCDAAGVLTTAFIGNDTLLNITVIDFPFDTVVSAQVSGDLNVQSRVEFPSVLDSILCKTLGNVEVLVDVSL